MGAVVKNAVVVVETALLGMLTYLVLSLPNAGLNEVLVLMPIWVAVGIPLLLIVAKAFLRKALVPVICALILLALTTSLLIINGNTPENSGALVTCLLSFVTVALLAYALSNVKKRWNVSYIKAFTGHWAMSLAFLGIVIYLYFVTQHGTEIAHFERFQVTGILMQIITIALPIVYIPYVYLCWRKLEIKLAPYIFFAIEVIAFLIAYLISGIFDFEAWHYSIYLYAVGVIVVGLNLAYAAVSAVEAVVKKDRSSSAEKRASLIAFLIYIVASILYAALPVFTEPGLGTSLLVLNELMYFGAFQVAYVLIFYKRCSSEFVPLLIAILTTVMIYVLIIVTGLNNEDMGTIIILFPLVLLNFIYGIVLAAHTIKQFVRKDKK